MLIMQFSTLFQFSKETYLKQLDTLQDIVEWSKNTIFLSIKKK
jgi:hypothetical protein